MTKKLNKLIFNPFSKTEHMGHVTHVKSLILPAEFKTGFGFHIHCEIKCQFQKVLK